MDEQRFDELTKALVAAKPSRREALRRLAGGALAAVFGGVALEEVSAQDVGTEALTCGQFCRSDAECNAGLQCGDASERCVAIPDSRKRCNSNGDCTQEFETCNSRDRCVNTVAPSDCPDCRAHGDCAAGERCDNGRCIEAECTRDRQCRRNERCRRYRCVR
jgi:hypothetical protein